MSLICGDLIFRSEPAMNAYGAVTDPDWRRILASQAGEPDDAHPAPITARRILVRGV